MARQNSKKFLNKSIKKIIILVIPFLIIDLLFGIFLLKNYQVQVSNYIGSSANIYIQRIDDNFDHINYQVINMLIKGREVKDILRFPKESPGKDEEILDFINAKNDLIDDLNEMSSTYGEEYHFWFYAVGSGVYADSSANDDAGRFKAKEAFRTMILERIKKGTLETSKKRKWFLLRGNGKNYIISVFENRGCYLGCWMEEEDFAKPFLSLEKMNGSAVLLLNSEGLPCSVQGNSETCIQIAKKEGKRGSTGFLSPYLIRDYSLKYGDFQIRIIANSGLINQTFIFQVILIFVTLIVSGVIIYLLYYVRRGILKPIRYFMDNLASFQLTGNLKGYNRYAEFEEAEKLFHTLGEKIEKLKIDIYEEKLQKQRIELDYLQLQIKPHFYINCLNNIYSMAQIKKWKEIQDLAIYVSNYLRYIFRRGMDPVLLRDELELVKNYLEIQKILYHRSLEYKIRADEEAFLCEIPPLLIQTFVENSIKYTMDLDTVVVITVSASVTRYVDTDWMILEVQDTGKGYDEERLKKLNGGEFGEGEGGRQVGIWNAYQRLKLLYGEGADIKFCNHIRGGACVRIQIPREKGGMG